MQAGVNFWDLSGFQVFHNIYESNHYFMTVRWIGQGALKICKVWGDIILYGTNKVSIS